LNGAAQRVTRVPLQRPETPMCGNPACGKPLRPSAQKKGHCDDKCRFAAWDSKHPRVGTAGRAQADLFTDDTPVDEGYEIGLAARDAATETAPVDVREALESLARELAGLAGEHGVTVGDVALVAERRDITVPEKAHWLGSLMEGAGLRSTDRMRRSPIPKHHGRRHVVWVA
jgi:hypothetical protein